MATYLQDGVGAFPQEQPFVPNYNFIMRTLDMRQNQYDQGFAQLKSTYNSVLNSELLRTSNKETRDQIITNAQTALKDLPTVDLGNPKNVTAAQSVFKPFYENDDILVDMVFTKENKNQISRGTSLENSSDEKERKRFWTQGIEDLYNNQDEFKNATDEEARNMRSRRFVGKPQVADQILDMFTTGKLKRSIDVITGGIKYTYENGKEQEIPLTNLYLALAENDPEAMEGFNVLGRVSRTRFIKNNMANGMYATKEEAAAAHDKSLVNDYVSIQNKGIKQSNDSLSIINTRLKGLNAQLANGTILKGSKEERQLVEDELAKEQLTNRLTLYNTNIQNAETKISRDPVNYLATLYLNKNASDLASALSSVSGSVVKEEFISQKEIEVFKTNELIRLRKVESELKMNEMRLKDELDPEDYKGSDGGSGGSGGSTTSFSKNELAAIAKNLNIPQVKQNIAASGVGSRADGKPDSYAQSIETKRNTTDQYTQTKAAFIFEVLDANEIVNEKGEVLDQNQMRALLDNGTLLDQLYSKAATKAKAYADSDPEKYLQLFETQEKVDRLYQSWKATDAQMGAWNKEIVGNLAAKETYPERTEEVTVTSGSPAIGGIAGGSASSSTTFKTTKRIPAKDEGWYYKHLLKETGSLVSSTEVDLFIKGVQKDKQFDVKVKEQYEKNLKDYNSSSLPSIIGAVAAPVVSQVLKARQGVPTLEQAKTQVTNQIKEKFTGFRNKVIDSWNDRGLNVLTKYAPIPGGGGTTARTTTFTGSNTVANETADILTADLLSKVPGLDGKDMFVIQGPNAPKKNINDKDEQLQELVQNGILSTEIMNSIKAGKNADLKVYNLEVSMVGGNDPNYHAYTLTFDPDFINKLKGTDNKGILGEKADKLVNGITIFINKNKDNTIASSKSSVSEIDVLVNTSPQGTLEKEVTKDYKISISKNPISGEYKVKTNFIDITQENIEGTPKELEVIVPPGTDLSNIYYQTLTGLKRMYGTHQKLKKDYIKNQPADTKASRESIDELKAQMQNQ